VSGETISQRIVLVFGSGTDAQSSTALASDSSELALLLKRSTGPLNIGVVSLGISREIAGTSEHIRLDDAGAGLADRLLRAVGAFALSAWFARFPIGRLLNSLGPVDQGRVFWRAVRRQPDAMRLIKAANVVIATDVPATKTAWIAARRGWVTDAFYDHRSASVGIDWQLPASTKAPQG